MYVKRERNEYTRFTIKIDGKIHTPTPGAPLMVLAILIDT